MEKDEFIKILIRHEIRPVDPEKPGEFDWENYDTSKQIIRAIIQEQDGKCESYDTMVGWAIDWLGC